MMPPFRYYLPVLDNCQVGDKTAMNATLLRTTRVLVIATLN